MVYPKIFKDIALATPVIGEIVGERDGLRKKYGTLLTEYDLLSHQLARVSSECDRLSNEIAAVISDRDRLSDESMAVISERDRLNSENYAFLAERERLQKEFAALAADLDLVRKDLVLASQERDQLRRIVDYHEMSNYVRQALATIERSITDKTTRIELYKQLRELALSDFGHLLLTMPNPEFPRLSRLLPSMADEQVQRNWTGSSGVTLLIQTLDFVRSLTYNFAKFTGSNLEGKKVLDFGCGYGRIARIMYYFTDEEDFFGVDPWDKSIELCLASGLKTNYHISEYLPRQLPVKEVLFDLVYAFSVFTHLSQKAATISLNTISDYLKPEGMIAITIRPIEYWNIDKYAVNDNSVDYQKKIHEESGFSFKPHHRDPVEGDITYGDTSMSLDWIKQNFPNLEVAGMDRSLNDPYQIYVFLKKKKENNL